MKRTMTAAEFCRYAHEQEWSVLLFTACNQPEDDGVIRQDMTFDRVFAEPSLNMVVLQCECGSMRIGNVRSVSVDTGFTVLGDYIVIRSQPGRDAAEHSIVLIAR